MKINPGKCKAVSFTKTRVKERIGYYFGDQIIPETSSFKYLGTRQKRSGKRFKSGAKKSG